MGFFGVVALALFSSALTPMPTRARSTPTKPAGRARSRFWSVEEAAALLDVEAGVITRALELDKGRIFAGSFFSEPDNGWRIPQDCITALLAGRPREAMLSLQSVAKVLDCSYHHAFRRMKALGLVVELPELGLHRVPEAALWKLCRRAG